MTKEMQVLDEILEMSEKIWNFGYAHIDEMKESPEDLIDWSKATAMEGVLGAYFLEAGTARLEGQADLLVDQGWLLTALQARRSAGLTDDQIQQHLHHYQNRCLIHQIRGEMEALTRIGEANPYERILLSAQADLSYLQEYQMPVAEEERDLAEFFFAYDKEKLAAMGQHIAEAFLHGFISQSRDRRGRKRVRFFYQIGQEALAKEVVKALKEKGLSPVVSKPQSLLMTGQWATDHQKDQAAFYDAKAHVSFMEVYESLAGEYAQALDDTCGMIGIGQFGQEANIFLPSLNAYQPTEQESKWMEERARLKRRVEGKVLKPSRLSFCKVTFPNRLIGEDFEAIFEDFYDLNIEESEPFELIQQTMIDALDTCSRVSIKGRRGNLTDLTVKLPKLENPDKQTLFLNCGGDLNIPYGELFTTPMLAGTSGTYHVSEIVLAKVGYKNLILEFKDGRIVDYGCQNLGEEDEDRAFVKENLFGGREDLTMGEFAIGSNTRAFAIAKRHRLVSRLPILLVEKMGPHIAIGDPCFARGEDAAIYNLYDKKEMVARENAHTACRMEEGDQVYFNRHIDITLPYDEIGAVIGVRESGEEVPIIVEGRFVLPGTEILNLPLDQLESEA